jgi:hypothetical protein
MAIDPRQWSEARRLCRRAFGSSMHFAFASVDEDGSPRATPIGSLILREDGTGYFFEEFASGLGRNLNRSPRVCILAVNSGKLFWFKSLLMGRFAEPPGLRLLGTAGAPPQGRSRGARALDATGEAAALAQRPRVALAKSGLGSGHSVRRYRTDPPGRDDARLVLRPAARPLFQNGKNCFGGVSTWRPKAI